MGNLHALSLTELIIKTGIHDAIACKLNEKGKLSSNTVAEGIINNVRKTIIRDRLTDPRFYAEMSKLLDDLIKQSRADAAAYEAFLKQAEAKWAGHASRTHLNTFRGGSCVRHFETRLDSRPAGEVDRTGKRDAPAIYRTREPLPLGSPSLAINRASRCQALRFARPQTHHPHRAPRQ